MDEAVATQALICRVRTRRCALPLAQVVEIMRMLPIESLVGAPRFVLGVAVIRGAPLPVIDAARLLGAAEGPCARLVTVRIADRQAALAVDDVVGISALPHDGLHALPPLLREVCAETVTAIGTLDAALLLLLGDARLVPEELWAAIDARALSR